MAYAFTWNSHVANMFSTVGKANTGPSFILDNATSNAGI